jgi:hypothetical protein
MYQAPVNRRKPDALASLANPAPISFAPPTTVAPEEIGTDAILPKNQGAFLSALQWIGRPGQVVKNVLTGNLEGAARQAGDFVGEAVDAAIPFVDAIPQFSRPEDEIQGSALLGLSDEWRKEHPLLNMAASLPVDILTDPISLTGFAPLAKAAGAVGKVAAGGIRQLPRGQEALTGLSDAVTKSGQALRSIGGAQRLTPEVEAAGRAAAAAKGNVAVAGTKEAERIFAGFTPKELDVAGDVADGLLHDAAGRPLSVLPGDSIAQRIANHPEAIGMDPAKLERAIRDTEAFMARQGTEGGIGAVKPNVSEMLGGGTATAGNAALPIFRPEGGLRDYIPRLYKGETEEQALNKLLGETAQTGAPKAIAERSLEGPADIIDYFAKNPNLTYTRNLAERVLGRVGQQSELGKRAVLGQQILQAVKDGRITLPESELRKISEDIAKRKAVRLGENTGADIAPAAAAPGDTLFKAGVGGQSGMSRPPSATAPVDLMGAERAVLDPYGIGSQSGRARPYGSAPDAGLPTGLESLGSSLPSGLSRPPSEAASGLDLLGGVGRLGDSPMGSFSGLSKPPTQAASGLDLLGGAGPRVSDDIYGVGAQSGKAIAPGGNVARQAVDPMASLAGKSKPISDLTKTVDHIMTHEFRLADPASRSIVNAAIKGMDPESARYAADLFRGLAPRGPVTEALSKVNGTIKKMMVMGYVVPKVGALIRNNIGGIWQAGSNPASRAVAIEQAKRLPSNLYGAVVDSLGLKIPKDALGQAGKVIEDAFKASGGVADNAIQAIASGPGAAGFTGQQLADVVRSGAMSGFVSTEDILRSIAGSPKAKTWKSIADWPARMFKGVEDRMRLGMGLDLLKRGESPENIGKIVGDSLYSYDVSSAGNRAIRDFLPFSQFSMKAGVQQTKLMNEKPWLAVGLSSLLTEKDGQATYPYMQGKLNIPLGEDEQGNQTYASGLGLPFEALNMLPNPSGSLQELGRDVGRSIVGSSQPLLKTAGAFAFGNDPTFGSAPGSYSKLPGNIEGGAAGRAYNILAGAGLTQPVESSLRLLGKLADDRGTAGTKALDLLTGASVVNVDPDRALQQRLTAFLRANPEIASVESLYSKTDDPQAQQLIKELAAARKRLKEKRQASAPIPGPQR